MNNNFLLKLTENDFLDKLNKIIVETDKNNRNNLIIELYVLDYLHTPSKYCKITPLDTLINRTFINENRSPTYEEYIEYYDAKNADFIYKMENSNEYKKYLTDTNLKQLLFNLYNQEDLLIRLQYLTAYLKPIKIKTEKQKELKKKEVIQILRDNDIYKIGNYHKLENATKETLIREAKFHGLDIVNIWKRHNYISV